MDFNDLDAVTKIEQELCECPWTRAIFEDCLQYYDCFVLEDKTDNKVIGYTVLSFVLDESHLLNLAVIKTHQRKGFGLKLVKHAMEFARAKKATVIFLEVRKNNIKAVNLYNKLGFNQIGTRKEYYLTKNGKEDALVLAAKL